MKIIVITGPTATGKTALAVKLARFFDGEIISADSRQVYRGLDIGSGKDLAEYGTGDNRVPAHLIDIADPADPEPYSLADFMRDAKAAAAGIAERGKVPFLCGGTPLYIDALIRGYELPGGPADRAFRQSVQTLSAGELREFRKDAQDLAHGEAENPYRMTRKLEIQQSAGRCSSAGGAIPDAEFLVIGTYLPREQVRAKIEKRLDERLRSGMIEEAVRLYEQGVSWDRMEKFGLEYRALAQYLRDNRPFEEMRQELLTNIRRFAKRQDTWFRKMERENLPIYWTSPSDLEKATALCRSFLEGAEIPPPAFRLEPNPKRAVNTSRNP